VFLEKVPRKKGICNIVYTKQVLEVVISPYFVSSSLEEQERFIFIKDSAKVY